MKLFFILLLCNSALASGDGHAGPSSLISSAVNLSLLVAFLIWKLKPLISNTFKTKSTETKEMIERAASKAKEAKMMMETEQKKIASLDAEIQKLEQDAREQVNRFDSEYKAETLDRMNKLKEDAGNKIESEKKELLDKLNSQLLDQVIASTKRKLAADNTLSSDATKKILQGLN